MDRSLKNTAQPSPPAMVTRSPGSRPLAGPTITISPPARPLEICTSEVCSSVAPTCTSRRAIRPPSTTNTYLAPPPSVRSALSGTAIAPCACRGGPHGCFVELLFGLGLARLGCAEINLGVLDVTLGHRPFLEQALHPLVVGCREATLRLRRERRGLDRVGSEPGQGLALVHGLALLDEDLLDHFRNGRRDAYDHRRLQGA